MSTAPEHSNEFPALLVVETPDPQNFLQQVLPQELGREHIPEVHVIQNARIFRILFAAISKDVLNRLGKAFEGVKGTRAFANILPRGKGLNDIDKNVATAQRVVASGLPSPASDAPVAEQDDLEKWSEG